MLPWGRNQFLDANICSDASHILCLPRSQVSVFTLHAWAAPAVAPKLKLCLWADFCRSMCATQQKTLKMHYIGFLKQHTIQKVKFIVQTLISAWSTPSDKHLTQTFQCTQDDALWPLVLYRFSWDLKFIDINNSRQNTSALTFRSILTFFLLFLVGEFLLNGINLLWGDEVPNVVTDTHSVQMTPNVIG